MLHVTEDNSSLDLWRQLLKNSSLLFSSAQAGFIIIKDFSRRHSLHMSVEGL